MAVNIAELDFALQNFPPSQRQSRVSSDDPLISDRRDAQDPVRQIREMPWFSRV
jgi:hypothetical protein